MTPIERKKLSDAIKAIEYMVKHKKTSILIRYTNTKGKWFFSVGLYKSKHTDFAQGAAELLQEIYKNELSQEQTGAAIL